MAKIYCVGPINLMQPLFANNNQYLWGSPVYSEDGTMVMLAGSPGRFENMLQHAPQVQIFQTEEDLRQYRDANPQLWDDTYEE